MNLPNALTFLRILLIPVIASLLIYRDYTLALVLFVIAGVSDALDGILARALGKKTKLGGFLDPLADKLLTVSCFVLLAQAGALPTWLAALVISRDVLISLGVLMFLVTAHPLDFRPSLVSKLNTSCQLLTIFVALLYRGIQGAPMPLPILVWLTGVLTVASGLHYLARGIRAAGG
ncbi:MAG: CDP-alcohol phosphatidyltransferase family protein [Deltaproteobacteria bacterium]|nr:CDP-alcohol phosphatidyltransferase family protein [Deltaproteobacteria bacterium]